MCVVGASIESVVVRRWGGVEKCGGVEPGEVQLVAHTRPTENAVEGVDGLTLVIIP